MLSNSSPTRCASMCNRHWTDMRQMDMPCVPDWVREFTITIFFFFQAEDGIRDIGVTGVQTCALPILGPGPMGLLLAQVVKSQGATVIMTGIEKDKERLEFAKKLGVDRVVNVQAESLSDVIMEMTDGYGVDRGFDCSGFMPAVNEALPLLKKKGVFVQLGIFAKKFNEMDQETIIQREITYVGSRSQKPSSWVTSLELLESGKVDTEVLITKIVGLSEFHEGIEDLMAGKEIKVAVEDRKSTRLNSSHANISYAVFCLKKKNKSWSAQ